MNILVYKRTHIGDPNIQGYFGIHNCMGKVRMYDFDAIIGVGGIGREPIQHNISRKITWIGVKPIRIKKKDSYDLISFKHFVLLDEDGPFLETFAPQIARRLFQFKARFIFKSISNIEEKEAMSIIEWSYKRIASHISQLDGSLRKLKICKKKC